MGEDARRDDLPAGDLLIPVTSLEQAEAVMRAHEAVILYFTAAGCNVCQAVKPRVIALSQQYRVPMLLAAIDETTAFSAQRLVFTIPTVLILFQGREVARESRFINFEQLERTLSLLKD